MKRFLSLALLALFCLFAYQAKADVTELTLNGSTELSGYATITCSITLSSAGSLTVNEIDNLYTDENCSTGGVAGAYTSGSYVYSNLDAGTYYGKVSCMGSSTITTSFEASEDESGGSVSYDFSVVSVTAADGTDLTGSITADNTLDLAVLEDGMQMVIYCSEATGNYLNITFGTVGTEQYLTATSDRLTADEDGNFTWTGGWDYELTEGYVYPVVCDLYNAQHNGTLIASATVLTLVGTSENKVSDVTLVSSDPDYNSSEDIEVIEGEDLTITLTFSDYVDITASINQGLYGSVSLTAKGVEGTGDDNGCYTTWIVTVPASELEDEYYGDEITITIFGTDANGKLLFDKSGYNTYTYAYTLVGADVDLSDYTFDPEDGSTVEELSTITVGNENGISASYNGTITITDEDGTTVASLTGDNCEMNYESDEEPDASSGTHGEDTGFSTAYSLIITLPEAITTNGTYTVNIPHSFFIIGEDDFATNSPKITLTYTVSGSSDSGEGEGEGEGSGEGEESGNGEGDENGGTETGISAIQAAIANGAEVYTISGQKVATPVNGVNIVKYADGSVKKILQK